MTTDEIIEKLRMMARYPTVTVPRDREALMMAADLLAQPVEHIVHSNGRYSPLLTRMMNKRNESNIKQTIDLYDSPEQADKQEPWVGLTKEEAADCWSNEAVRTWRNIEAKLREKNT